MLKDPDTLLFTVLPYVALVLFFLVTIQRYRARSFTYSSLSSQLLENQHHFWGSVPFHYGILSVLAGHFLAFAVPKGILWWNGVPLRLYLLEATGLALGLLTLVGLINTLLRRGLSVKCRRVTSAGDWVILALLLVQVVTGVWVAVTYRWGSSWFAGVATPYLWSLVKLDPQVQFVAPLPWLIKTHIANAFLLIAVFPFTRLVHILVVPNPYLWRRPQVVLWNNPRRRVVED